MINGVGEQESTRTESHTNHSSDRRRAAGFVTLTPRAFALTRSSVKTTFVRETGDEPLKDSDTVAATDVVCDLRSESLVVHQQKIQLPDVADQELFKAVGEEVTGLSYEVSQRLQFQLLRADMPSYCYRNQSIEHKSEWYSCRGYAQTYLGHGELTLEAPPHSVINTFGLPPCLLHTLVTVGLVAPTENKIEHRSSRSTRVVWTDLKGLVRFLTIVILAMVNYGTKNRQLCALPEIRLEGSGRLLHPEWSESIQPKLTGSTA